MNKVGFDNQLYLEKQSQNILKRIETFHNKLYLEFGGKLFDDLHASRVLPGFDPNIKTKLLLKLKDKAEIVFCISARDIEKNKIRADFGISYDNEVLRLVDKLRGLGLYVSSIVITLFKGQPSAEKFANMLKKRGENVYFHTYTKGYPSDVNTIVSDEGYGANPYIVTTKPLVVVTAPGPSSGKLATCMSQLYHEYKRGVQAGYAKFETFPVWNLPLKHPVNLAYEAATADLQDVNQLDPFYFETYGKLSINYNRDIEAFPVLKNILRKITGGTPYASPTDMGVNMVGFAITDDAVVREAASREIVRRYFHTECDYLKGNATEETWNRMQFLLSESDVQPQDVPCVAACRRLTEAKQIHAVAIELPSGEVVTGKQKDVFTASATALLNALKTLSNIQDNEDIIDEEVLQSIRSLRKTISGLPGMALDMEDALMALAVTSVRVPQAKQALEALKEISNAEAHASYMLSSKEEMAWKKLGVHITCEPKYFNQSLYNM